ncbi:MAG: glycoside hydrolase family 2 TIM barrel-domain containing protein [Stellaceae bacterium]
MDVEGTVLTSPSYTVEGWLQAVVPGSVLATLVANGKVPDPYYGDCSKAILDITDRRAGAGYYTYWFYNQFDLQAIAPGTRVELQFDGINDTAETYLNGQKLESTATGMFVRRGFDVTAFVRPGKNQLAVLVHPPDPPGVPNGNGGKNDDRNIGESVVARYPVGWDWVIPMADRSAGLWDRVTVRLTGPVVIGPLHVVTSVPGVRVPGGQQAPASVTIRTPLENTSKVSVTGILEYAIAGKTEQSVTVIIPPSGEHEVTHEFTHTIEEPRLWWPNGLGRPELYTLDVSFTIAGVMSDHTATRFGIRQIDVSKIELPRRGGSRSTRVFAVNGQRIFLRGGNWIGTDAMFRFSANEKRYRDEVRMHADANLNILRVWGGGISERTPFYDACDELGMLVMQDFWISGEYNPDSRPEEWREAFLACARDNIKRLRNHPSLLFWSAGNEASPPQDVLEKLKGYIEGNGGDALDGTRILVPLSTDISGSSDNPNEDGPYGVLPPKFFFSNRFTNPINPEIGSVGTPTYESMQRFMPPDALKKFPKECQPYDQLNAVWQHHDYIPYFDKDECPVDQIAIYGAVCNTEEFCYRAQLANYIQYRALFEGFSALMWNWYAGVFLWKSQSPWPGLRGQLYDWYLEQTGGLFGVRRACEPVHIQLDLEKQEVMVVNTSSAAFEGSATASIYDLLGTVTSGGVHNVSVKPPAAVSLFGLQNVPKTPGTVYFVDLRLANQGGEVVSTNLYWLSTGDDYQALQKLRPAKVDATGRLQRAGDRWVLTAELSCPTPQPVAFWIQLQVRAQSGERPRPVFYSDNYLSLAPGSRRTITVDMAAEDVPADAEPELWLEGWNVAETRIPLGRLNK